MLVGRRQELGEIARLLEDAAAGRGRLLVVSGAPGSGKTALAHAAVDEARGRGLEVVRAAPPPGQPGRMVWAQLLRDLGADEATASALLANPSAMALDEAARRLVSGRGRLVVVDDVDRGGPEAVALLSLAGGRVGAAGTAILATSTTSLGLGHELRLGGLSEAELAEVIGEDIGEDIGEGPPDVIRALWFASRGMPGVARSFAATLRTGAEGGDAVVRLALEAPSRAAFLEVDSALVRLLELALARADSDEAQARLSSRLARELLGDASAAARRRELVDEALTLARRSGDAATLATVLDARLHALWDAPGADDRLAAASEIVDLARASGEGEQERRGLFWRFVALMELGRVGEAESALAAFEREAALAGDDEGAVMATARHAMLAWLRGRYAESARLIAEVAEAGRRVGLADTENLVGTLRGSLLIECGTPDDAAGALEMLHASERRHPGQLFEALTAGVLALFGRVEEARVELERILPRALAGSGPRWLGSVTILAFVAASCDDAGAAALLRDALLPYRGRLAVLGGANTVIRPVSHALGELSRQLGDFDAAVALLGEAIDFAEQTGALPLLAHGLSSLADTLDARAADDDASVARGLRNRARSIAEALGMTVLLGRLGPPDEADDAGETASLVQDGELWTVRYAGTTARLRDSKGLHYLAALVAHPGVERHCLDLVALTDPAASRAAASVRRNLGDAGPVLDDRSKAAYRQRLIDLREEVEEAEAFNDDERAARAQAQIDALTVELARAVGLGGRDRRAASAAERARLNVTRALRSAIGRVQDAMPELGAHLDRRVRTGLFCAYEPTPEDTVTWA